MEDVSEGHSPRADISSTGATQLKHGFKHRKGQKSVSYQVKYALTTEDAD